ncbi:MAG TPA: ParB/RepB/Spo0J family partition protein [Polyangia bacterium]|nr:ParB/RepB/Spo0J family partition protein [Polyangia bacterium]
MSAPKRQALGRGLAALIPGASPPVAPATPPARGDGLRTLAIEDVHPSPGQPRKTFDDARLDELAASIRAQGIIQPLVVRAREAGGFELIAGERRWRAAQRAGLHEVPVVVRDVAELRAFEMAIVENLQREDLNPIEEAQGFERLIEEFDYTQEALAERVGKDRSTVANALRLLRLPAGVRTLVTEGKLSMGHARALLGLEDADAIETLARRIVARELSVRQVEQLVRRMREGGDTAKAAPAPRSSTSARDLAERLTRALGTRVKVVEEGPGKGRLEISYHSLDQLDGVLGRLLGD